MKSRVRKDQRILGRSDKKKSGIYLKTVVLSFVLFCFVLPSLSALAAEARLSDSAGFLSSEEKNTVEEDLKTILDRNNISVYMITSSGIEKKEDAVDYLKEQKKEIKDKDLILILVNATKKNYFCKILVYGDAKKRLTGSRVDKLENFVEGKLSEEEYFDALHMLSGKILEQYTKNPVFDIVFFHPLFQLLFCLVLTIGGMYFVLYRKKEKEEQAVRYLDKRYSTMQGSIDHFSHKSLKALKSKKKKEKKA